MRIFVFVLGVVLGLLFAWSRSIVAFVHAPGNVQCAVKGKFCVGSNAQEGLRTLYWEKEIGGLVSVSCGIRRFDHGSYEATGDSSYLDLAQVIAHGCQTDSYVASFSDGDYLTNLWVTKDKIVQVDRYSARAIDL